MNTFKLKNYSCYHKFLFFPYPIDLEMRKNSNHAVPSWLEQFVNFEPQIFYQSLKGHFFLHMFLKLLFLPK